MDRRHRGPRPYYPDRGGAEVHPAAWEGAGRTWYTVTPVEGGTRVGWTWEIERAGLWKHFGTHPAMAMFGRRLQRDLDNRKVMVESVGYEDSCDRQSVHADDGLEPCRRFRHGDRRAGRGHCLDLATRLISEFHRGSSW
jgi:hypothetical protein